MIQRSERFTKAYDSLIQAFFNGTLGKGTCMACACGNIIAGACGINFTREEMLQELMRDRKLAAHPKVMNIISKWSPDRLYFGQNAIVALPDRKDRVNVAGYTVEEFVEIERAFECATKILATNYYRSNEQAILEDQYNGLCAVVDVLLKLEGEDAGGDELKAKFREHPKLAIA